MNPFKGVVTNKIWCGVNQCRKYRIHCHHDFYVTFHAKMPQIVFIEWQFLVFFILINDLCVGFKSMHFQYRLESRHKGCTLPPCRHRCISLLTNSFLQKSSTSECMVLFTQWRSEKCDCCSSCVELNNVATDRCSLILHSPLSTLPAVAPYIPYVSRRFWRSSFACFMGFSSGQGGCEW